MARHRCNRWIRRVVLADGPTVLPAGCSRLSLLHDHGTTVILRLADLLSNTDYIPHVHKEPCATGGGDHYRFHPKGGELPPNEIHIDVTSGDDGAGFMTAENSRRVDETAHSVIVQTTAEGGLLCADLQ